MDWRITFLIYLMVFAPSLSFAEIYVDDMFKLPDGQYHVKIEGRPSFLMSFKTPSGESTVLALPQLEMHGAKISQALYALYATEIQDFFEEVKSELGPSIHDPLYRSHDESLWFEIFHRGNLPRAMAGIWFEEEVEIGKNFKKQIHGSHKGNPIQAIEEFHIPKVGDAKKELMLRGEQALIVTHASLIFDKAAKTKVGLDQLIDHFKQQKWPVAFIMGDDELYDFTWFSRDHFPTLAIFSRDGDHHLKLATQKVYLAGGYFSLCLNRTLTQIANGGTSSIKIYLPMNAIYEDVYFWPITHLRGADKLRALAWIAQTKDTTTLQEYFENLGARAIIDGTKTLLSMIPSNYTISIAMNGKVMYTRGNYKKKIILEFLSSTPL